MIETNAAKIYSWITGDCELEDWKLDPVLQDITFLISFFNHCLVQWVRGEVNCSADLIAKQCQGCDHVLILVNMSFVVLGN